MTGLRGAYRAGPFPSAILPAITGTSRCTGGSLGIGDRARARKPAHAMIIGQASWGFGDDAPVSRVIGNRLRDHYQPVIREPMPARLLQLLRQADAKSPSKERRSPSNLKKR
jgi:hypothetical protein